MDTKQCRYCKRDLPLHQFYKESSYQDGYRTICKGCNAHTQGRIYLGVRNKDREIPDGHKWCPRCERVLPFSAFVKCRSKSSGFQSHCQECRKIARRKGKQPEILPDGMKRCFSCKNLLPATTEFFSRDKRSPTGLQGRCKACYKLYRQDNNQHIIQQKREYYRENQVEIRIKQRGRYYENHEQILERQRKRYREDRDRIRGYAHSRRTRELELPNLFSEKLWHVCLEYWKHRCSVCGNDQKLELDHWIALKHPNCPGTIPTNLIVLCKSCNCSKNARHPTDWLKWKLGERVGNQKLTEIEAYFEYVRTLIYEE